MLKTIYNGVPFSQPIDGYGIFVAWFEEESKFENQNFNVVSFNEKNSSLNIAKFPYGIKKKKWVSYNQFYEAVSVLNGTLVQVEKTPYFTQWNFFKKNLKYTIEFKSENSTTYINQKEIKFRMMFIQSESDNFKMPDFNDSEIDSNSIEQCSSSSKYNCPIDPETNKPMEICLNWRRIDDIGKECQILLTPSLRESSIEVFCKTEINSKDCKCVNRIFDEEYNTKKSLEPYKYLHDFCWYENCKSGYYLLNEVGKEFNCESQFCIVNYNTESGNDLNFFNNKTVIVCKDNIESQNNNSKTKNNNDWIEKNGVLILISIVIIFLFLF